MRIGEILREDTLTAEKAKEEVPVPRRCRGRARGLVRLHVSALALSLLRKAILWLSQVSHLILAHLRFKMESNRCAIRANRCEIGANRCGFKSSKFF